MEKESAARVTRTGKEYGDPETKGKVVIQTPEARKKTERELVKLGWPGNPRAYIEGLTPSPEQTSQFQETDNPTIQKTNFDSGITTKTHIDNRMTEENETLQKRSTRRSQHTKGIRK